MHNNIIPINQNVTPAYAAAEAAKLMWDKTRSVSELSDILGKYASTLDPIIASETDEEAREQFCLIKASILALVDGPVLKLFELYDDQLVEMGNV